MFSSRALALLALAPVLLSSVAADFPQHPSTNQQPADNAAFQKLLKDVPSTSLHEALHDHHPAFQDGIFIEDHSAAIALHNHDPPLASKVVEAARVDILKRQNDNSTTTTTTTSTGPTTTSVSTTIQTSVVVSTSTAPTTVPISTSAPQSSPSPQSPSPSPQSPSPAPSSSPASSPAPIVPGTASSLPQSSPQPLPSSPQSSSSIPVVTSTQPITSIAVTTPAASFTAPVVVTTDQFGNLITLSGATPGAVITTTDAAGRIVTTTFHPGGGVASSTVVRVSTLPNGSASKVTSVAIVPVTASQSSAQVAPASQVSTGQPGLVTGNVGVASRRIGKEAVALLGGAVGVAWLL